MERKLASVQKILKIDPIEGADKIERITVLGWHCVSAKGNFQVGDLCVFFEVDSLIPNTPWSEFLFKGSHKDDEKIRLRTIRLRGQISQGLAIPFNTLFEIKKITWHGACFGSGTELDTFVYKYSSPSVMGTNVILDHVHNKETIVGNDISEMLDIKKYDPPIPAQLAGKIKGRRPAFIPKTDEIRIQTVPDVLSRKMTEVFYITEKIDGSSMSVYIKDGEFGVCSRNLEILEDENNSLWKVVRELRLKEKLTKYGSDMLIQGELYGEGIQKNKYKIKGLKFAVFNVMDLKEGKFLDFGYFKIFCESIGVETVPILDERFILNSSVDELVYYSIGNSQLNNQVKREGLVFRSLKEERDEDLGRLSFKVINPEFLIKHEE